MEKITENGVIKINNSVFTKMISTALSKVEGRGHLANSKGKILGGIDKKLSHGEIFQNIELNVDDINRQIELKLYIVTEFGYSIRECSDRMLDSIEWDLKSMFPGMSGTISLKIVGVRSKKTVLRDIEIVRKYEVNR